LAQASAPLLTQAPVPARILAPVLVPPEAPDAESLEQPATTQSATAKEISSITKRGMIFSV
jgi:hypothetical protein